MTETDPLKETEPVKEPEVKPAKPKKLTKYGVPDDRSETSKKNIAKARQALKQKHSEADKILNKRNKLVVIPEVSSGSESEYSDSEDEAYLIKKLQKKKPDTPTPLPTPMPTPMPAPTANDDIVAIKQTLKQLQEENENIKKTIEKNRKISHLNNLSALSQKMLMRF